MGYNHIVTAILLCPYCQEVNEEKKNDKKRETGTRDETEMWLNFESQEIQL